jgi:tetratricopeptide (TPR) repeat protein
MIEAPYIALRRAEALREAKRPDEALAQLGPALADEGTVFQALVLQALTYADLGRTAEGLKAAKAAQGREPLNEQGFRIEGLIRINKLKGEGAAPVLRESVRLAPNLWNQYLLVHALPRKKDRVEARRIATQLNAQYPNQPQPLDALGIVELRERNWVAAENLYRRAAELDPHEALYATRLGIALQAQRKTAPAAEAYLAAARADPTDASHRRRVGQVGLPIGAAGVFAVGKFGLIPLLAKLLAFGSLSRLVNHGTHIGGGGRHALAGVWIALTLLALLSVAVRAVRLRRGIAVLPPSLQSTLRRDNRVSLGRLSMVWSAILAVPAAWLTVASAPAGAPYLALTSGFFVSGWWFGGRPLPRLRRPDVAELDLVIGGSTIVAVAIWFCAYMFVFPGLHAPKWVLVLALPALGLTVALAVLGPTIAAVRGKGRRSDRARAMLAPYVLVSTALLAFLELIGMVACLGAAHKIPSLGMALGISVLATLAIGRFGYDASRKVSET